jgi:hypothetical protein
MKKIESLTPEQIEIMPVIAKKWIDLAHSGKFDESKARKGIELVYRLAGIKQPERICITTSPMAARLAIGILKTESLWANVGDNVRDNVRANVRANVWANVGANVGDNVLDNVWANVRANVWDNVGANVLDNVWDNVLDNVGANVGDNVRANVRANVLDNVWDNVGANVRDNVWANVWANVRANVWANVGDNVGDNVWANVRDNVLDNVWDNVGANVRDNVWANVRDNAWANARAATALDYLDFSDYGFTAWAEFFHQCDFEFTKSEAWIHFEEWRNALEGNIFEVFTYEKVAFIVMPPSKIIKNEDGRLHNPQGPAVEFPDGYCQYYINGRCLPSWIWGQRETITREMFLQEKNAEIRGGMYAVLGQKRVFDLIGAAEISRKYANDETYILYRTNEKIGEKYWQWVGVKCPSTGTDYLLGVPESVTCPIEAVAGTWGLTASEYIINQHT